MHLQFFQPVLEVLPGDAHGLGGPGDIAPVLGQGLAQKAPPGLRHGLLHGLGGLVRRRRHRMARGVQDVLRDIGRGDQVLLLGDDVHGVFQGVLQLPDVAGPVIGLKQGQGLRGQGAHVFQQLVVVLPNKGLGQGQDVRLPVPQGRDADVDNAQAVIQVLAQQTLLDGLLGRDVDIGQDAHIHLNLGVAAHPAEVSLLDHPQQL